MGMVGGGFEAALDGHCNVLREGTLALPKQERHLLRWTPQLSTFAEEHRGRTFEPTLPVSSPPSENVPDVQR